MAVSHTPSGAVVAVGPDSPGETATVVSAPTLKVARLVVPAGKDIAEHSAPGDITVQCLTGAIDFTAGGRTTRLGPGHLLYLGAGVRHALRGVEDAVVLVTAVSR
ncbi:MAG TPA: cupin domain-containing protein [Gemmataceae bacterium]|nr:cupin domain-containing protein [Gemmataceae bacterium]